tara:strand:- start:1105 stop:1392 length:288 start_codon:yes stop_codon:yes gene_type:complete
MIIDLSKSSLSDVTLYNPLKYSKRPAVERLTVDSDGVPNNVNWNLKALYDIVCQLMPNVDITIYFTPEDMDYIIDTDQHWFWEKLKNSVEMIAKK